MRGVLLNVVFMLPSVHTVLLELTVVVRVARFDPAAFRTAICGSNFRTKLVP